MIPLLGVGLQAFRAYPNGFPCQADRPNLSDTVNKYLHENRLLESEQFTLKGQCHAFTDRMPAAGIDERIRRDLKVWAESGHS